MNRLNRALEDINIVLTGSILKKNPACVTEVQKTIMNGVFLKYSDIYKIPTLELRKEYFKNFIIEESKNYTIYRRK